MTTVRPTAPEPRFRKLLALAAAARRVTPVDEAAIVRLLLDNGHTEASIAKAIGAPWEYVDSLFVLSTLPADVQDGVRVGRLTLDDALTLSMAD